MVENKAHVLWAFLFLITISSSVFPSLYQENFLPHISIAIGREQIEQIPISSVFPIGDAHPRRDRGRVITFLGHCVEELRRVQWPDRRQVGQATAVVLGFVVLAGGYLGLMDALWKPIVNAII
jgi:preprotein translocase SecE subunit